MSRSGPNTTNNNFKHINIKMNPLSNSKMMKLVRRLLGVETLAGQDGHVSLTPEQRDKVRATYGDKFLQTLESLDTSAADELDASQELFDTAVEHAAQARAAEQDAVIAQLREDVRTLSAAPEQLPAPKAAPAASAGTVINMAARHNALAARILASDNPMAAAEVALSTRMDSGVDVTDLNAEFGTVMPPRARIDILKKNIYLGLPDSGAFTRKQSNTDYKAAVAEIGEIVQQFTPKWTPKGSVKFSPATVKYRRHKINVPINPTEVIKSWLVYLYEQGKTMQAMPVTRYIVDSLIMPKVADDVTRSMLGKGKYEEVATAEGSEGPASLKSMDGIETILVDGLTDADCRFNYYKDAQNPFTLTGQDLLDYVREFAMSVSPYFVDKPEILCSEEFLEHYQAQYDAVNGKYAGREVGRRIPFTGFSLNPLKCMYNSPILFATPLANRVMLVDYANAANCINKIEEQNYDVKVFGEFSLSVGFPIEEAVYAAVPGSYKPSDAVIGNTPDVSAADSKWQHGKESA